MILLSYSSLKIKLWCKRNAYILPLLQINKHPSVIMWLSVYRFAHWAADDSISASLWAHGSVSLRWRSMRRPGPLAPHWKTKRPALHHLEVPWNCFPPKSKCKENITNDLEGQIWHFKTRTLREQRKLELYSKEATYSGEIQHNIGVAKSQYISIYLSHCKVL